jgi:hypothetical protein
VPPGGLAGGRRQRRHCRDDPGRADVPFEIISGGLDRRACALVAEHYQSGGVFSPATPRICSRRLAGLA